MTTWELNAGQILEEICRCTRNLRFLSSGALLMRKELAYLGRVPRSKETVYLSLSGQSYLIQLSASTREISLQSTITAARENRRLLSVGAMFMVRVLRTVTKLMQQHFYTLWVCTWFNSRQSCLREICAFNRLIGPIFQQYKGKLEISEENDIFSEIYD